MRSDKGAKASSAPVDEANTTNTRNTTVFDNAANDAELTDVRSLMRRLYDYYYASENYERRYPVPNPFVMDYILANGGSAAQEILDFGCGNGRYALSLLEQCSANITGYDISAVSLAEFSRRLESTAHTGRVRLIDGELDKLGQTRRYDIALMLFGVLSHVGIREERLRVLRKLRALIKEDGRLILSVPSIYRRRPLELLKSALMRRFHKARPPEDEPGNIYFTRVVKGRPIVFFYHLYSISDLTRDLLECSFAVRACRPESLLPEWLITQYPLVARLDRCVSRWLPAALGYGICVIAEPVQNETAQ